MVCLACCLGQILCRIAVNHTEHCCCRPSDRGGGISGTASRRTEVWSGRKALGHAAKSRVCVGSAAGVSPDGRAGVTALPDGGLSRGADHQAGHVSFPLRRLRGLLHLCVDRRNGQRAVPPAKPTGDGRSGAVSGKELHRLPSTVRPWWPYGPRPDEFDFSAGHGRRLTAGVHSERHRENAQLLHRRSAGRRSRPTP